MIVNASFALLKRYNVCIMSSSKNSTGANNIAQIFDTRYKKLNHAQKEAVDTIDGPLLVVAGPGSGKTEILSLRVAKILREAQVLPSNILCLTFTDSASINMRERLSRLMGSEAYRVAIHTFHSFCTDIIQKYPEFFYKGAIFSPADDISKVDILEQIFKDLPYNDLLNSYHPEKGYTYLRDASSTIGNLKKAGISPEKFREILAENKESIKRVNKILSQVVDKRISAEVINELFSALETLKESLRGSNEGVDRGVGEKHSRQYIGEFPSIEKSVAITLEEALRKASDSGKNEPISEWKKKWFVKNDEGERVFKDELNIDKMESVALVYEKYRQTMHSKCLFDFDDMILDVIEAIQKHPRLKYDLQEQYQYVLVDEFQDTNNAQMKVLSLILDAPVNEGRPNIMVVGDDDQAVYKFQGAELSNILNFKDSYRDVRVVNMTSNYRSTQDVLDIATKVIRKGEHRLENILPAFEKTLVSSNKELASGAIVHKTFDTSLHEYHYVSRRIKSLIESGVEAEEIAVIARKHKQLEALVPYLQGAKVPIKYKREQNVFLQPHIQQIILIARFVNSIASNNKDEADEYLPKILAFPFWAVPRMTIWNISRRAGAFEGDAGINSGAKKGWLACMLEEPATKPIAEFLIELGVMAQVEPLEKILDLIIGAHVQLALESEEDEEDAHKDTRKDARNEELAFTKKNDESKYEINNFSSPFKSYYFNKEKFEHARAEYLSFLSSLRVFVRAIREYKGRDVGNEYLKIDDLIYFVDIHEKNKIPLNDLSPFANASSAVSLLSAHNAKGLEFDTVFILSCQDDVWAGRGGSKLIKMPANLPIEPAGDNEDDQLRIFYVALTRAKRNLYLTSYKIQDDGKESSKLRFITDHEETIAPGEEDFNTIYTPETHDLLTASWIKYHTPPFLGEEQELLRSLLENYQLSVTHLNNFLNVTKGGPQLFLEQNLLRFPQAKTPSSAYGTAIHRTLERLSLKQRHEGAVPTKEECLDWFVQYLRSERLPKRDFDTYSERGVDALTVFYDDKIGEFKPTDKTEVNFKDQGVFIEEYFSAGAGDIDSNTSAGTLSAHLAGKIDRIVDMGGGRLEVFDYKTGKAKSEWKSSVEYEKIKLYEYERQLLFYNLLIENARDYKGKYRFEKGVLQFVEPEVSGKRKNILELSISDSEETREKKERTKKLAVIVFNKIKNLDFPDTSEYGEKLEDIVAFEDKLLEGF